MKKTLLRSIFSIATFVCILSLGYYHVGCQPSPPKIIHATPIHSLSSNTLAQNNDAPLIYEGILQKGETFSQILTKHGISASTAHNITQIFKTYADMKKLKPGDIYKLELAQNGEFKDLKYEISPENRYHIWIDKEELLAEKIAVNVDIRKVLIAGTIETTLLDAVISQGESINLAMALLEAFQWDINFYTDVQQGDSFSVLVEKVYVDNKPERIEKVLVAKYNGKTVGEKEAIFYKGEYFDNKGQYLQKRFLTTPLDVISVTSKFGQRFHPLVGRHIHKGIDYGARTGTTVWSVADGKVVMAGNRNDGYGNQVLIEHTSGYVSRYAHLSKINVRNNQKIKQKMKIGAVGSTGLSTGPHLHFEILINGVAINPASQKMVPSKPKRVKNITEFMMARSNIIKDMQETIIANQSTIPTNEDNKNIRLLTNLILTKSYLKTNLSNNLDDNAVENLQSNLSIWDRFVDM